MIQDQRDTLWDISFDTYYDSYHEELLANKLLYRWQLFDQICKVITAVTASGSAIAGWALWSRPGWEYVWLTVAGAGALFSILHAALGVSSYLKEWTDVKIVFLRLRTDLETFRIRMRLDPKFTIDDYTKEYEQYRKRYAEGLNIVKVDFLRTRRLELRAMDELDIILIAEIQPNSTTSRGS
jgi:hypothetical protein